MKINQPQVNLEYKGVVTDIKNLLDQLGYDINRHGSYQTITWGHVGSARHVKEKLMEISMFLNMNDVNADEDEYLADLENQLKAKRGAK